jgi:hypothetical protein
MVLLEAPDKNSLVFAVIPSSHRSALNIPKSSHVPAATDPEVRLRCRAGKLTEPPCPIHCPSKAWFRWCLKMRRKWGGAPMCRNHLRFRWWIGCSSKCTGKWLNRNRRYAAPFGLLGKTWSLRADLLRRPHSYWSQIDVDIFSDGGVGSFYLLIYGYYESLQYPSFWIASHQ